MPRKKHVISLDSSSPLGSPRPPSLFEMFAEKSLTSRTEGQASSVGASGSRMLGNTRELEIQEVEADTQFTGLGTPRELSHGLKEQAAEEQLVSGGVTRNQHLSSSAKVDTTTGVGAMPMPNPDAVIPTLPPIGFVSKAVRDSELAVWQGSTSPLLSSLQETTSSNKVLIRDMVTSMQEGFQDIKCTLQNVLNAQSPPMIAPNTAGTALFDAELHVDVRRMLTEIKSTRADQKMSFSDKDLLCDIATTLQDGFQDIRRTLDKKSEPPTFPRDSVGTALFDAELHGDMRRLLEELRSTQANQDKCRQEMERRMECQLGELARKFENCVGTANNQMVKKFESCVGTTNSQLVKKFESCVASANSELVTKLEGCVAMTISEQMPQGEMRQNPIQTELSHEPVSSVTSKAPLVTSDTKLPSPHPNVAKQVNLESANERQQVQKLFNKVGRYAQQEKMKRHMEKMERRKTERVQAKLVANPSKTNPTRWVRVATSKSFIVLTMTVIAVNAIWIAAGADAEMKQWRDGKYEDPPKWHGYIELAFTILFVIEICIRIKAFRLAFFIGKDWRFNIFELLIVLESISSSLLLEWSSNMTGLRLLRFLRLTRMLRVFRIFNAFSDLRVLIYTLSDGAKPMLSCFLLFLLWVFIVSITLVEVLLSWGSKSSASTAAMIDEDFGSLWETMLTLIHVCTGGQQWGALTKKFGREVPMARVVLILYVVPVVFGLVPIIFGIFVSKVFQVQKEDTQFAMRQRLKEADKFFRELQHLLRDHGFGMDAYINEDHLDSIMTLQGVEIFLDSHGIELSQDQILDLFDGDEDGAVTVKEFVYAVQWMWLYNRSTDDVYMAEQLNNVTNNLRAVKEGTREVHEKMVGMQADLANFKLAARSPPSKCARDRIGTI